uniref:Type I-U CRISPR-associated protein Csx17 n=1 Tax=Desertifilum tharense IPPAS B-1220 TaxID=1781255 RepID=A0ACD5GPG3_9CYAN
MAILALRGCTPEPLSHYLKALGVLRLVVEQRDSQALGYWKDECFWLETQVSETELVQFFLEIYKPTPLIAPWNGSTGFYAKDKAQHKLLEAFIDSPLERFKDYGKTIAIAIAEVNALQLKAQPQNEEKRYLLERLRNSLPDAAVQWLDTCALITAETLNFPPLAGTGETMATLSLAAPICSRFRNSLTWKRGKLGRVLNECSEPPCWVMQSPDFSFLAKLDNLTRLRLEGQMQRRDMMVRRGLILGILS